MNIIIIIFATLFAVLAIKKLDWALFILITALPAYLLRFHIGPLPSTILEIMIIIVFAVWFFKEGRPWQNFHFFKKDKAKKINYPFYREIIAVLVIAYLALIPAHFQNDALGIFKAYFFEPILLFIVIVNVYYKKSSFQAIFWALSVSAFLVSAWAIVQKISGQFISNPFWSNPETFRAVSFYGYPNAIGLYLGPIIILLSAFTYSLIQKKEYVKNKSAKLKLAYLIFSTLISLLAIILARSNGALAALALSSLAILLIHSRKSRYLALVLTIAGGILILALPNLKSAIVEKASLEGLSGRIRELQWKETKKMLNDGRFISGAGLNQYPHVVAPYHQEGFFFNRDKIDNFDEQLRASQEMRAKYWQPLEIYQYPHNIFLNFWSEIGFFGLLIFIWLILRFLYLSFKLAKRYKKNKQTTNRLITLGLFGGMLTIFLHGLVDVPYFKNDLSVLFWIMIAMLAILILKTNENNTAKINR